MTLFHHIPLLISFLAATFICTVSSASVQHALRYQVPEIAFVGRSYEWSFSPSTFRPDQSGHDESALSYRAEDVPAWLTFNPSSRSFSGTPAATDEGSSTVQVFVSEMDDSDSVDSFQLIVYSDSPPTEAHSFGDQFTVDNPHISSADVITEMEGGPGVRVREAWSFSIGLEWDTFVSSNGKAIYYSATLLNRDPLPSWMTFNEDQMTFDGVTPRLHSENDPTRFDIVLYGSEKEGYAAVQDSFSFVIESSINPSELAVTHTFDLASSLVPVNVTAESAFSFDFDLYDFAGLELDGEAADRHNLSDILVDSSGYPWLSYDNNTSRLSGTPPADFLHESSPILPLQLLSKYENLSITANITLHILPSIFTANVLPPVIAPPSSHLSFALDQYFINRTGVPPSSLTVGMDLNPREASQWLTLEQPSHVASGIVPASVAYSSLTVMFHAMDPSTNAISSTSLLVNLSAPAESRSTESGLSRHNRVVVGATVGAVLGFVFLCLLLACCRWCYSRHGDDGETEPYSIDHGVHGDRLAAGMAQAKGAGIAHSLSLDGINMAEKTGPADHDGFESVHLGDPAVVRPVIRSRPPSTHSTASSAAHGTDAKMAKGAFFQKLNVLSERSVNTPRQGSMGSRSSSSQRHRGKENEVPGSTSFRRLSTGGRIAMMFGFVGRGSESSSSSRPIIGHPMPMPPGSAGAALKMGMRTGTTPPPPSSPSIASIRSPPMLPTISTGSIKDDIINRPRMPRRVSVSRSMNDVARSASAGGRGLHLHASSSQNSGLASTSESGETLEGGVDRTSWAEEPHYVWASSKIKMSPPKSNASSTSGGPPSHVVSARVSLDSVIPKRRKDFAPPPRLIIPTPPGQRYPGQALPLTNGIESSRSLAMSLNDVEIPSNRMSAVSFNSVAARDSHSEDVDSGLEDVVVQTVSQRQTITAVATPVISVLSSNDSIRFGGGAPSYDSAQSSSDQGDPTPARPRLVAFHSEHKPVGTTTTQGQRSVSHVAVVTDAASKDTIARPPKLVMTSFGHDSLDMDDRLGLGIDYVRAFGIDAPSPTVIEAQAAVIQSSTSGGSWTSYDNAKRRMAKDSYGYLQRNDDISRATSSKDSPSLASLLSSVTTPESAYSPNMPQHSTVQHTLAPRGSAGTSSSNTSIRRSTHRILVGAGQPFNFSVPLSVRLDEGGAEVVARLDDGQEELPDWLRFDAKEMEFWGVPPVMEGGGKSKMVEVSVWQEERCVAVFMVEVVN